MTPRDRRRRPSDPPEPDRRRRAARPDEPPSWRNPLGTNPLHDEARERRHDDPAASGRRRSDPYTSRPDRPGAYRDADDAANRPYGRLRGASGERARRRAGGGGEPRAGPGRPVQPNPHASDPRADPPRGTGGHGAGAQGGYGGQPAGTGGYYEGQQPGGGGYGGPPEGAGHYGDPRIGGARGPGAYGGQSPGTAGYGAGPYGGDPGGAYGQPRGGPEHRDAGGGSPYGDAYGDPYSDAWAPGGRGREGRGSGRRGPAHRRPRYALRRLVVLLVVGALLGGGAVAVQRFVLTDDEAPEQASPTETPDTTARDEGGEAPEPAGPASGFETPGLLTFRGSPTRSYYGEGPVPEDPGIVWDYPGESGGMCAESSVGNETKVWCGTGWTGQPSVFERDGRTWVVFGAYDRHVHFVDYETGEDIIPPFPTGDIIKGSVSVDPDGYPLVYSGSRDNKLHVISIEGPQPVELWSLDAQAVQPTLWNDDWDGSPLVIDDYLYEGGENSQFHIVKLNRSYAEDGSVRVDPELVFNTPGWDDELLGALGDNEVSVENSVAIHEGVVYFANSGGLVQGWDISGVAQGTDPTRVFRFWTGDDTDASVVVDDEGFLYVASEYERFTARSDEVGQLMKLDPRKPDDPLVWSVHDPDATSGTTAGIWATPAIHRDIVIAPTNGGSVLGVDRATGDIRWQFELTPPTWQSPVVVDDVLVQGDCDGVLHAYDVSDTTVRPPELWTVELGGCIESTPAVWDGRIFVGTRGGRFFAIGDT